MQLWSKVYICFHLHLGHECHVILGFWLFLWVVLFPGLNYGTAYTFDIPRQRHIIWNLKCILDFHAHSQKYTYKLIWDTPTLIKKSVSTFSQRLRNHCSVLLFLVINLFLYCEVQVITCIMNLISRFKWVDNMNAVKKKKAVPSRFICYWWSTLLFMHWYDERHSFLPSLYNLIKG